MSMADCPALKMANIGIAFGIKGSDLAKDASDIIFMDEDFTHVMKAIAYARANFANVEKFISLTISYTLVSCFLHFCGVILLGRMVFSPIQILWVGFVVSTCASIAYASDITQETAQFEL